MTAQHTPGPWRLVVRATQAGISKLTVTTDGRGGTCWNADAKHLTEQHRADARIMTAAPDLLDAAKLADAVLANAGFSPTDPDLLRIRAAIAKAEGRS